MRGEFQIVVAAAACMVAGPACAAGSSANSPDGRYQATIRPNGAGDADGNAAQVIVMVDRRTGVSRRIVTSSYDDDHTRNMTNLDGLIFSLDGGFLYVSSSDVSPYRSAVHQIDLRSGRVRFVTGGWGLSVIRTGPYRGYLLVQKHQVASRPGGGTVNSVFVVRPDGHQEMMVPGSQDDDEQLAVGPWLAARGWHAW